MKKPPIDLNSELLNFLVQGNFPVGERLPTLTELQSEDQLNISISKIREQLEVARAMGLVEVRSKTGMRMQPYSFTPAVRLSLLYAIAQDIQHFALFGSLRVHVETAYWEEACLTLTDEDHRWMQQCIDTARVKLGNPGDHWIQIPHQEHRDFHLRVFTHLENPFVSGILEAYWDAYTAVELNLYADYTYHQTVWNYHQKILDCLCAQDIQQAKTLFIQHTQLLRVQDPTQGEAPPKKDS
ncbi:MAG: FadR/GntR family transcriptional regulator [Phototrophicaceae bacterium]|jgi:DNA-binding FadR family transcriptional regulator